MALMIMPVERMFCKNYRLQCVLYDNGLQELGSQIENSINFVKFPSPKFTDSFKSIFNPDGTDIFMN
jgi:hypothetical protein